MARKPNYDFERRERERLKSLKTAARAEVKLKAASPDTPADPEAEPDAVEKPAGETQ